MAETQNKLPISVDVSVSLSKAQVAAGTDMTIICFCTPNVDFLQGERVKVYSTADAFNKICTPGDSVYWAGNAFFSKTKRPKRIAVGKVFSENQPAYVLSGGCNPASLKSIKDGKFDITVGGSVKNVSGLDFSSTTDLASVAGVINTAVSEFGSCTVFNDKLILKSTASGNEVTISYASDPETGTGVSDALGFTKETGASLSDGYTAGNLATEMQAIADFATKSGLFFFGWTLDSEYRDTEAQADAMRWVNARSYRAVGSFATNNANAYDQSNTTNNGYVAMNEGLNACAFTYDDNAQYYPDISYLANFLAVDYSGQNTTITGKFKDAEGIPAVNFPDIETNVSTLSSKRINTLTGIVGQTIKYFREGNQSGSAWSTDGWVNACNFIAELEINILNAFLRTNKIPYTTDGQNILLAVASKTCNKYKENGSFSDRVEEDSTAESGVKIVPACTIDIQELSATTAAQRAAHIGTPMTITANDSGWMGSIQINVNVVA